jgi:parallel beta-helix repeat protein
MLYDGKATISGNYIGTDNTGLLDKGNGIGIATSYSMTGMVIGGSDAGERNVISGNTTGIVVNTPGLTIQGNYIGPGADGVTGIGNSTGISIYDDTADLDIYSNVISFNYLGIGASADGQYALYNIHIHDNLIGTDSTGDNPAGNNTGISISLPAPQDPDMQGPLSGLEIIGNTISDNNNVGIAISDYSFSWYEYTETRIENNRIGLKKNSDTALGNAIGISIGGHAPIGSINNGNLIKYNTSVGIIASNVSETSILGNTIESNAIGIIFEGTPSSTITNNSFIDNTTGMIIRDSSNQNNITNNTFCSSSGGEIDIQNSNNNIFRYNKFGSTNDTSLEITGTSIGNAIIENDFSISTEIPIDLGDDGATVNDLGDSDTGANNRQNYPYNISLVGENIEFDIDSNAADYRIEFHVPDSGSCSELSSLMCSGGIDHAGGTVVSYSLYCPGLPLGDFDIYGLAILEPTPFEYSDTSELSPLTTLNNPGPTNTPTPTETPVPTATDTPVPTSTDTPVPTATDTPEPTATNTPLPTSTNTPIPTATSTPMPTPTFTPLPTPTNTPIPSFTNTPTTESTGTPQVTSVPEATSAFIEPTSQQSLTDPSPTVENIGVKSTTTPTQTIRPTSQIPENVIENLELDLSPNDTYAIPDDSIIKTPVVKSSTLSFTQRLDDFVTDSPMIGNLLKTSISMGERIKPLSDNLNYLLSLQFIGLQTAQVGVTTLNVLALATPAIVTAFSQPKILYYALAWFWKRKSKQPWGIVYDKATGAPVAFASLVLSQEGKTVSTQATDLQGKYGFFVNKGKYQLYISHSDYLELVSDIEVAYDGEIISQDFEVIAKSRDDVNSNIRWSVYKLKRQLAKNLFILNTTIFSIGFVYTIFAITNHLTIINYVILSLYLFQFLLMIVFYFFKEKEFGQVLDVSTGLPVSGAIVRIFNEDRQIDVAITDKQGRYSFILEPGNYYLKATANGYVFPSENTPNITKNKLGNKLLKFTTQDKQRVNITVYMRKFATLNANKQVILSPFN